MAGICIAILAYTLLFPVTVGQPTDNFKSRALSNIKQVALCTMIYLTDSDDRYPCVLTWNEALSPYVKNQDLFNLTKERLTLSPAMNGLLNLARQPAKNPDQVVMLFETLGPGKDFWGGPTGAWEGHGDRHSVNIAYCDTHARPTPRPMLSDLCWRPEFPATEGRP